jgi:hypothetical protein
MANPTPKTQIWEDSCWAACMEMWTHCVVNMERHAEQWFCDTYTDRGVFGLTPGGSKYWALLNKYFLSEKVFQGRAMSDKDIKEPLKKGGCFMYIEDYGDTSHARLAYGYNASYKYLESVDPAKGLGCKIDHYLEGLGTIIVVYKL